MPQRFLKPGITTSRKWDSCSWTAQSFYIRLLTLVDDFGRYDGDPVLLRSHAFPLREDIRAQQVQQLCVELQANQLAVFYKADGKDYVQLTNWTERPRADKSRYPDQTDNVATPTANELNLTTSAVSPQDSAEKSCLPRSSSSTIVPRSSPSALPESFLRFYSAYPRKVAKLDAQKAWTKIPNHDQLLPKILAALESAKSSDDWKKEDGRFIPYPATWLNGRRWDDDFKPTVAPAKPAASPDVCVLGAERWTLARPPQRKFWAAGPDGDSAFESHNAHFQKWLANRNQQN